MIPSLIAINYMGKATRRFFRGEGGEASPCVEGGMVWRICRVECQVVSYCWTTMLMESGAPPGEEQKK